ncbi:MAG: hypothetical protein GX333_05935 [Syntrophomonadaceae bacterium]|nr:hypothetical protein [Syntrophomonadaceae bacterium]
MDDLGKILAQSILANINEIEETTNLDYLIKNAEPDIKEEASKIKDNINSIKQILESI